MTKPRLRDPPVVLSGTSLPHALRDMSRPPEQAYLWGRLPPGPRIGLVGTREPSARGCRIAFEVARQLAALGMTIVSGGALGIDRAAHLGALRAGGQTLVVAPLWLHRAYPKANRRLFAHVLARGGGYLAVSEPDAEPFAPTFARRNEVLVALSDIVLLGEAGAPSGSLMAGRFARQTGVPELVLPWAHDALDLRGLEGELERGARGYFNPTQLVRLLEGRLFDNPTYWERSLRAVRERQGALEAKNALRKRKKVSALTDPPDSARAKPRAPSKHAAKARPANVDDPVLSAIAGGATTVDAITEQTELAAADIQYRVLLLTLEGVVLRDEAGLLRPRG